MKFNWLNSVPVFCGALGLMLDFNLTPRRDCILLTLLWPRLVPGMRSSFLSHVQHTPWDNWPCVLILAKDIRIDLWSPNDSLEKTTPPFEILRKASPSTYLTPHSQVCKRVAAWRNMGLLTFKSHLWLGRVVGPNLAKALYFLFLCWGWVGESRHISSGRSDWIRTRWPLFHQGPKWITKVIGPASVLLRDFPNLRQLGLQ